MSGPASIFDDMERTLDGPADHTIPDFDYLNASRRAEAVRVRDLLDAMFQRYPASSQAGLRSRLRSRDDLTHNAALFELIVHELLLRCSCQVIEVEPQLSGSPKNPDFLAETPDGQRFYLEAVVASGRSDLDAAAEARLNQAIQAIDQVPSPDYFLSLNTTGVPAEPISGKRLRSNVTRWLSSLDFDQVQRACERNDFSAFRFTYEQHGVRFEIEPVPRGKLRGQAHSRSIGARMIAPGWVQPREPIRRAIIDKASRYGKLDLPFVVAVNALSDYADVDDSVAALFGSESVIVTRHADGSTSCSPEREFDGVWRSATGPRYTRVSAVLSLQRLTAWSIGSRTATLIENPWASRPISLQIGSNVIRVEDEQLRRETGRSLADLLELPTGWPEVGIEQRPAAGG